MLKWCSLCVHTQSQLFSLYKDASHTGLGDIVVSYSLILANVKRKIQGRSHTEELEVPQVNGGVRKILSAVGNTASLGNYSTLLLQRVVMAQVKTGCVTVKL